MQHVRTELVEGLDYQREEPEAEPLVCETCLGSGKVCIKCQEPMPRCRCVEMVGEAADVMSGYEPVLCDRCEGEGTV
jgi:hypothetical protein